MIVLLSIFIFFSSAAYLISEEISLGPLFYYKSNKDSNEKKISALGPLFFYNKDKMHNELGIRPLFYKKYDNYEKKNKIDVIYPLFGYRSKDSDWRVQMFSYLISYEMNKRGEETVKKFNFFPFIFSRYSNKKDDNYFAIFPIYGNIKNKFSKDHIKFFLFPLFLQTKKNQNINNNILWPFFGYQSGTDYEGFKIWPLYGYKKNKDNTYNEQFILWPFIIKRKRVFYDDEHNTFSFLPFYTKYKSNDIEQTSYLWPFISHYKNNKTNIERVDAPWPFINFTKGDKTQYRIFPFYSIKKYNEDNKGFILWPLYRYNNVYLEDYIISRKSILLFIYNDKQEIPLNISGRNSRRIALWPIFSYYRDREGNSSLRIFSVLEPFLPDNSGIENNYSALWTIYENKKFLNGKEITTILWNTYRKESYNGSLSIKFSPILPLFEYNRNDKGKKYVILGGVITINRVNVINNNNLAALMLSKNYDE